MFVFFFLSVCFPGGLLALSISAYGCGFTLAFLWPAAAEISPHMPQGKECNQADQVPGLPHCRTSKTLVLAQKGVVDRGGLWAVGLNYPMA